jgi:hypothetical protein
MVEIEWESDDQNLRSKRNLLSPIESQHLTTVGF